MSVLQALLISAGCYLAAECVPWLYGSYGGYYILSKPLVSGLIVGLILGDVKTGIMVGAAVQTVYLANMTVGGTYQTDITIVAYPAVALGIVAGGNSEIAISIATGLGLLGVFIVYGFFTINSFWNSLTDKQIDKGSYKGIALVGVGGPQITFFLLRFVPTFLVLYYGAEYVTQIETWLPEAVVSIMVVASGVLPAIGLAIILSIIVHENTDWLIFLVGFMLVVYLHLDLLSIAIIGIITSVFVYKNSIKGKLETNVEKDDMEVTF